MASARALRVLADGVMVTGVPPTVSVNEVEVRDGLRGRILNRRQGAHG